MEPIGKIHSYETFGATDGPGLRFVLFMQGCNLRCRYCHNPDTWNPCSPTARTVTVPEIVREVLKYRNYYRNGGGLTASGGEPLLQLDFLISLFERLRAEGISTALDTSGAEYDPSDARFGQLLAVTDLVLLDIKHIDDTACRRLTGRGNSQTLAFAERLDRDGIPVWIRQVLVPGHTDGEDSLRAAGRFIASLGNVKRVQVLPYHTLGREKYGQLGLSYPLDGVPVPSEEEIRRAERLLGCG